MKKRCGWVNLDCPQYVKYHDEEWGVKSHDDLYLFEMLILEGAQAGLSWLTILKKRENYRRAFDSFDFEKIAKYDEKKIEELLLNTGIVRNRLKIRSTVSNARAFIQIREGFGLFASYVWEFVNDQTIKGGWNKRTEIPATTKISDLISKDLKKRGFNFVGPTIIYAFMQAVGLVNDHEKSCFRYGEI
ncbi:MAG: DNA-3-methyladenine glycosylase I [Nanoarchaeota archaeon]|nr:DNA-3-methyladenine glycosylase I [Nanoarchaeota archaeon]